MKTIFILLFVPLLSLAQSADDYYQYGKDAYDKKDYTASVDYFTKAINLSPKGYSYWYRGAAYWELMDYSKAKEDYSRALLYADNDADRATLLDNRGYCEFMLFEYESAIKDYKEYLKLVPGKANGYNQMGRCYLGMDQYETAMDAFQNALLLADKDADRAIFKYNMGLAQTNLLNYPAAQQLYTEAIQLDPDYENAWYQRAHVCAKRKIYNSAIDDFNKALTLITSEISKANIYLQLALVYDQANETDKAFQNFKKATDLDNANEDAWYDLGRFVKLKMKNDALASGFLDRAISLSAGTDTSSTYAYSKMMQGKQKEAISFQLRKIENSKTNEYRYKWELHNMACLQALAGNTPKALEYVEKSFAAGFNDFNHLLNDRDLRSLFGTIQWKNMLVKYKVPKPKY